MLVQHFQELLASAKLKAQEGVNGVLEIVVYFKEVKRPAMIEEFFSCFGIIDRHQILTVKVLLNENVNGVHTSGGIV